MNIDITWDMLSEEQKAWVSFAFHSFGDRGSSCVEAASIGGMAHLTQFMGTDNFHALKTLNENYNSQSGSGKVKGLSIPATEHSTVTSWGRDKEFDMVMNYIETFKKSPIIACVADSYDVFNFVNNVTKGEFKSKIESPEYPIFVIRPDSGNPIEVINAIINIMEENSVAFTINAKGYKVWNKYRIIWGDGITPNSIRDILEEITERGYSASNIAFGSGGDLMQNVNRDTSKYAIKCSSVTVNNEPRDVFKDPITDHGKRSKKGVLSLFKRGNEYFTDVRNRPWEDNVIEVMEDVWENGVFKRIQSFDNIREISASFL